MGTLFFDGKTPYIDGWDHKGISLYLINAFGYLIGFKNYIGIRVLEIFLISISFLSIFKNLSITYSKKNAFIAVVFGLLSLRYFFDGGNMTEEYGAIFTLISLSLLIKEKIKTIDYAIIGALFIINFTIRANLISFWIALFFAIIALAFLQKEVLKKAIIPFSKMAIGIVVSIVLLSVYFLITNSFSEFYNAAFTYNFSYSKQSVGSVLKSIITSTRRYEVSLLLILGLLISVVSFFKKKNTLISLLLLFWIPIELYFSNMSGKLFAHYYMMWIPIIVLATAFILDYFKTESLKNEKQFVVIGIMVFLFFQIPIFNTLGSYQKLIASKKSKNELIANHIHKKYLDKTLLVWGNECAIYNMTKKIAPVTNFYQTLFKLDSRLTKRMIDDFTLQVQKKSPYLIIDVKTPSLLFLDNSNAAIIEDSQEENLKKYIDFIQTNYVLKETIKGADFYIRKE